MERLLQDLRIAARTLLRSPGFALIAIITLALGIGANTAIFSVVNAVLLRPLPYAEPDRLLTVFHFYPSLGDLEAGAAAPTYHDLREEGRIFESVAVRSWWNANLTGEGEPERVTGGLVSGYFFSTLGVPAAIGRTLLPEEAEAGRDRVVVLSHGFWNRRFGGDSGVVGQTIQLNGESYDVVGVMPPHFYDLIHPDAEVWAPITFQPAQLTARTNEFLTLIARLRPGVAEPQAQQAMAAFAEQLKRDNEGMYPADWTLRTRSLPEVATGGIRPALLILLGAVGLVLLIACANVANLLLARAAARSKEMAIRRAVGAKGSHLVRQLLTESMLLSLAGAALALLLAFGAIRLLVAVNPGNLPRVQEISIDATVLLFTVGIGVFTGLLFGLTPMLQAARTDLQSTLRQGGRSGTDASGQALRRGLVVAEVALALMLLIGAGLLIRSFAEVQRVDTGFNPDNVLTANIAVPTAKYTTQEARIAFFDEVLERLHALPGVQDVGAATTIPFSGGMATRSFAVEGLVLADGQPDPWGDYRVVTPGFHRTLQIPLLRGRYFTEQDRLGSPPVVIVDQGLVARYWPGEDPIGKRIGLGTLESGEPNWMEVVGVVGHAAQEGPGGEQRVQVYRPYLQIGGSSLTIAARTAGNPTAFVGSLRQVVSSVDPDQPIAQIRTMQEWLNTAVGERRFSMLLLGVFAGLALLLASVGIYGVISFDVTRRAQEMGIRVALGAERGSILSLVLGRGLKLTLIGVGVGLVGALALMRVIESQLYGVGSRDPITFVAVSGLLLGVALLAALIPALRATRVDPITALRAE